MDVAVAVELGMVAAVLLFVKDVTASVSALVSCRFRSAEPVLCQ